MCNLCIFIGVSATETALKVLRGIIILKSPSQGREIVGTLTRFRQSTGFVEGFLFRGTS